MAKSTIPRAPHPLLYVAAWLPLILLYAGAMRQAVASFPIALFYSATYFVPAIAIGGAVWRLARRVRWRELSGVKFAALEFAFSVGFVLFWQSAFAALLWILAGREVAFANSWLALFATADARVDANVWWAALMAVLIVAIHSTVFHAVRIIGERRTKELATVEAEAARARAEMLALRGQLDPHFLCNSLHSITALVREDPRRAEEALLQFAALLRRVLAIKRDATDEVTLADEMKFVDDYLAIERLRLGERLRVTCEISAEASACRLPAFSVQPLVENALRHAIAPRRDGGHVTVRAAVRAGRLDILVHDDGPGADPAAVVGATGVGLSVIRQRLRLRHGERAILTIDTALGKGFSATLSLPAEISDSTGGAP